jgi:hypothetical protein
LLPIDAEQITHLAIEVSEIGYGLVTMPTLTSRWLPRGSASMRKFTDLPVPGAPVTRLRR